MTTDRMSLGRVHAGWRLPVAGVAIVAEVLVIAVITVIAVIALPLPAQANAARDMPAHAPAEASISPASPRVALYVEELAGEGVTPSSASALTIALCRAMAAPDARDVHCAPDIQQLLRHASTLAALGTSSPALAALEARLSQVTFVVRGRLLAREGGSIRLELSLHDKSPNSSGVQIVAGALRAEAAGEVSSARAAEDVERIGRALVPMEPPPLPSPTPPGAAAR